MAQIQKYVAQEGLNPGSTPHIQISDALSNAVQGIGGAIGNLGEAIQQRKDKQADFKDQNAYRKFQLEQDQQMRDAAQDMAPDGEGFHDGFVSNIYKPARDKFLASVSPRNREKFQTILGDDGADTEEWSIKAANLQNDQATVWTKQQVADTTNQLGAAIAQNPAGYDDYLKQGYETIDTAPHLTAAERVKQRSDWETFAQVSFLNRQMQDDPEGVAKALGASPNVLSPTTQFGMLKKSLITQESGGNPNAISRKGAVGTMQVMPGTAIDIAKEMHDPNFNPEWNAQEITQYLANPSVNERYGDFYLKKQLRTYGPKGGVEAALIAYNGGPGAADKWLANGRDDSVLPKETRDYYHEIMGRLPGSTAAGKGDPKGVSLVFSGRTDISGQDEAHVNPELTSRVKTAFAALGIDKVKINSGFRSAVDNKRVGGAEHSQHMHGDAMDIDVSGYSIAERVQIIKTLSANGITGLGIGANMIHADVGGRRAWGYSGPAGGGAVPKWAAAAIADHLANRTVAPTSNLPGATGRFASLPYDKRQQLINQADQQITARYNAENKATAVQKVQLGQSMDNELASLTKTGQSTGFDETQVANVLGEDDYMKYAAKRDTALRTFNAVDGVATMTPEQMGDRLADYDPTPGSPTYARDLEVKAAVQKEIDRVTRQRATKPDEAALEDPNIKAAYAKMDVAQPQPADVQDFVKKMIEKQKEFGIKPGTEAPVPRPMALKIGEQLSKIPELGSKVGGERVTPAAVDHALIAQYTELQKYFGDYTDEVILYALQEYKGVGKNTGAQITAAMGAIAAGGDPWKRYQFGPAYDRDAQEAAMNPGIFSTIGKFLWPNDAEPAPAGDTEPSTPVDRGGAPSAETIQRVISNLNGATPEEEADIAARYGPAAYEAAKRKLADGRQQQDGND